MAEKFLAKGLTATVESDCVANGGRRLTGETTGTVTFNYEAKITVEGAPEANVDKLQGMLDQLKEISEDTTSLTTDFVAKYKEKKKAEDPDWTEPDWVKTIEIKEFTVPDKVEVMDSSGKKVSMTTEDIVKLLPEEEEDGAFGQFPHLLVNSLLVSMVFAHFC